MKETENLVSVYTGTEASAILLKGHLERVGISSVIKRVSNAGTWGTVPDNIDLFVESEDRKEAEPVIEEFVKGHLTERKP